MSLPTQTDFSVAATPPEVHLPPLQTGDRLTRAEFERRYHQMPEGVKCELIEGQVYVGPARVNAERHAVPKFHLVGWLGIYAAYTAGIRGGDNCTVRLDFDNQPQPDAFLRILHSHGGQSKISEDDYIEGAPELVAEIAASSASYDLHQKLEAYQQNGVREYIVCGTWDRQIDWFVLRDKTFQPLNPGEEGLYKSKVFPGLWLDAAAMLAGDRRRVMDVVLAGIASEEHQQFQKNLANAKQ